MSNETTPVKMWAVHGIVPCEGHTELFIFTSYDEAWTMAQNLKKEGDPDNLDVYITEFNDIYTNGSLGEFEADIVGGVVELLFTPISSATMTIKTVRTTIDT